MLCSFWAGEGCCWVVLELSECWADQLNILSAILGLACLEEQTSLVPLLVYSNSRPYNLLLRVMSYESHLHHILSNDLFSILRSTSTSSSICQTDPLTFFYCWMWISPLTCSNHLSLASLSLCSIRMTTTLLPPTIIFWTCAFLINLCCYSVWQWWELYEPIEKGVSFFGSTCKC